MDLMRSFDLVSLVHNSMTDSVLLGVYCGDPFLLFNYFKRVKENKILLIARENKVKQM